MKERKIKIPKSLSVFTLAMINVAAIGSVKNWPFIAEFGFSSLFYFIIAALVFFLPVSLVSAELATTWPQRGGVYLWMKEAFGPHIGFLAVWLQWLENIAWYPTVLSFSAATLAYIFDPFLINNTVYTITMVLIVFWGATIVNFFGMKTSGWISDMGAFCGTLIPGIMIILLGINWILDKAPLQIQFSLDTFFPELQFSSMVFFIGVMLSFTGMEMSAVHATDVQNPQKNFPKAIFLSVILILILSGLGVLSISMVVPRSEISLTAGTMQAFYAFLSKHNLKNLVPFTAALVAIGVFGSVSTWIIGPTKGLLTAGQEGHLPPLFHKINKHKAPIALMILQGIVASLLSLMFFLMPTINSGFWILTVLTAQLYLIMYILILAGALRLRYTQPKKHRPYKIPGGSIGIWIICSVGILTSIFALLIGYIPPQQIYVGNPLFYTGFLILGTILGCFVPFLILFFKKPNWKTL